ncbi:hypothetical protein EBZ37_15385, partial [bacterium]|nr:hypothetical protein [bacterium]
MIILLGFPKSGTTSFQELFTRLGYKSYHQRYGNYRIGELIKRNKELGLPLLSFIKEEERDKTAITQMDVCINDKINYWPQLFDFEQIYEENKDAIYILNRRDENNLLQSFKNWKNYDERLLDYNREIFLRVEGKTRDEKLLNFFREHYKRVVDFFRE